MEDYNLRNLFSSIVCKCNNEKKCQSWKKFCKHSDEISLNFIEKHKDKIDFIQLSENPNLTKEVAEKFSDYLDWDRINFFHKKNKKNKKNYIINEI